MALTLVAAAGLCLAARPARAEFGFAALDQQIVSDPAGDVFSQAGGHPYEIVTWVDFNSHVETGGLGGKLPDADVKDFIGELPPGLIGNPAAVAQCTDEQLAATNRGPLSLSAPECPTASEVGTIELTLNLVGKLEVPVYNMVPPVNEPGVLGYKILGESEYISGYVRNGSDFGLTLVSANTPNALPVDGFKLTVWGVPADPSHDIQRCNVEGSVEAPLVCQINNYATEGGPHADPEPAKAFITMPVGCTAPGVGLKTTMRIDSWPDPGAWVERSIFSHDPPGYPLPPSEWGAQVGTTGCERVPFHPSISVQPTNDQADTPSGLNVEISLPQEGLLNPQGIATADVKRAVVSLPAGESVSPSAADGLGACSPEQVGLSTNAPATCPDDSKLGTVEIETPLQKEPLKGGIFLGKPECGPCNVADDVAGRLLKMYIVAEGHGAIVKLAGHVELDPVTGRIVTIFDNNPQLPFDHLRLSFKAGPRSPLVNPPFCGSYSTDAEFTPWSGAAPVTVSSAFQITSGPGGTPCPPTPQAFGPSFVAGTTSNQAGGFSPLAVTFGRADGEQQLGGVTVQTPPGLLGTLSNVSLCPEPQASQGSCPSSSEIGSLSVAAGAGANPFYVTGGKVFLTVGYRGAPFGLSVVVPAKAGPLDLGTVVVRGSVSVDPTTTALTVSTDPLPTILDGIPLDLRTVHVLIDRPGFIFNPTSCERMSVSGTLTGGAGGVEPVSNSFQVTNCAVLGFKPSFKVFTSGRTSRANGASLDVKLSYPRGAFGRQSNIAKVKVDLPKQLPSRLGTLQKACPAEVFESDPAACPAASRIGYATAGTPVLPVRLAGPLYFVSHGGEAWPDLVVVLQGYGVTVHLVGTTFIKTGVTSTTFSTVPDVPVESFELKLPQGPYSALAANGSLCAATLRMPTAFVAQNGLTIKQSTPIAATGCPKRRPKHGRHGRRHKHHRKHKKK